MAHPTPIPESHNSEEGDPWQELADFSFPSEPGGERNAMEQVINSVSELGFSPTHLERLRTAIAEGILNAMEHGNDFRPELATLVKIFRSADRLKIKITDYGGGKEIKTSNVPDLEAKLEGLQSPRGWGLFLIKNMVDEMNIITDEKHHTLELIVKIQ
jgi:anti-sigma regulatory factor (Ser/Thr protein kinase)